MSKPYVAYEDNHLLVVSKPCGWLVQGDKTGDKTLTDWGKEYIKVKYEKPGEVFLHPTHRIDRPVSGLVIFSRTSKSLSRMTTAFREDKIDKRYLAIVQGRQKTRKRELVDFIIKDNRNNVSRVVTGKTRGAKEAQLSYRSLAIDERFSLFEVSPKTGRPHQIRVQLSHLGHPIKGDIKYGFPSANQNKGISLHAYKLEFEHPVKKERITIVSKPKWQLFSEEINGLG